MNLPCARIRRESSVRHQVDNLERARPRAAISRGHLLRSFKVVPKGGRLAAAEFCGYFRSPTEIAPGPPSTEPRGHDRAADAAGLAEKRAETRSQPGGQIRFLCAVQALSFRAKPARPSPVREPFAEEDLLGEDSPLPATPPLQPWSRLWPYLRRALGCQKESHRIDTRRLVRESAELRPMQRLPRVTFVTWADHACLVLDRRTALAPFWDDMDELARRLILLRGREGLRARWIEDGLEKGQAFDLFTRRACALKPEARMPVLVLSDMGCLSRDAQLVRAWLELAEDMDDQSIVGAALLPCPRDRWEGRLARRWRCACWDRHERLPQGRAGQRRRSLDSDQIHPEQRTAELLPLLSPAVRVEPGLLRTLRLLLGDRWADVGTEFDVWHHPEAANTPTAMALLPDAALQHRAGFEQKPPELKLAVVRGLEQFHAGCAPTVRPRETLNLAEGGIDLPLDKVEQARKHLKRIEDTLASLAAQPKNPKSRQLARRLGLFDWVDREMTRLSPQAMGQQGSALWAIKQCWSGLPVRELPKGIVRERVVEAMQALKAPESEILWEVRQIGSALSLKPANARLEPKTLDLPTGAPLAWLRDQRRQLMFFTEDAAGEVSQILLLPKAGVDVRFSMRAARSLKLASDLGEITFSSLTRPNWARRLGQDQAGLFAEFELKGDIFRLRWIPPGGFLMGSPEDEAGRNSDESPQHLVTISKGFWLAETLCTQVQWKAVMGKKPSQFNKPYDPKRPVGLVSWEDCRQFCARLRERVPDLDFRLPSEAEWEYACRAGTTSAFNDGSGCTEPTGKDPALERLGWYGQNSENKTQPAREKLPNAWGLYDMHGNVLEWCADGTRRYSSEPQTDPLGPVDDRSRRVVRGGAFWCDARICRSAFRIAFRPGDRYGDLGFRLAAGQPPGRGAPSQTAAGAAAPGPEAPAARPASGASRPGKKKKHKKR